MRVGSLFSGVGGLDLGLERAGMEVVWQVEIDDFCTRVLERHWPDVARFRDVQDCHGSLADAECAGLQRHGREHGLREAGTEVEASGCGGCLPYVDLICGGFPCQPVSHAGQRKGESDSRWLWPEFYRIVCEVQPRWVIIENVPGLRSIDSGRLFRGILWDLSQAGFDAVWMALSAADVGAPHLRERVFIVAHSDGSGRGERRGERRGAEPMEAEQRPVERSGEVAHAEGDGQSRSGETRAGRAGLEDGGQVADADEGGRRAGESDVSGQSQPDSEGCGWWTVEPDVGRVAHGIPARVDRLRGLGNAVVPQVAEVIGRWIMEMSNAR